MGTRFICFICSDHHPRAFGYIELVLRYAGDVIAQAGGPPPVSTEYRQWIGAHESCLEEVIGPLKYQRADEIPFQRCSFCGHWADQPNDLAIELRSDDPDFPRFLHAHVDCVNLAGEAETIVQ
jgi:hypothetical protein